jgi:hypothetical protein
MRGTRVSCCNGATTFGFASKIGRSGLATAMSTRLWLDLGDTAYLSLAAVG